MELHVALRGLSYNDCFRWFEVGLAIFCLKKSLVSCIENAVNSYSIVYR